MTVRLTILLAAAIGVAALATGCGGGSDSSATTTVSTSSLSKAQFIKQAGAICSQKREEFLRYESPSGSNVSETQEFQEAIQVAMVPALQEVVEEVRDLGAPQGDAPKIEAYLHSMEQGIETLEESGSSFSTLEELEKPFMPSGKLARQYGVERCGFGR